MDTVKDQELAKFLDFTEFLVFVSRLAFEIYRNESGDLDKKIVKMVKRMSAIVDDRFFDVSQVLPDHMILPRDEQYDKLIIQEADKRNQLLKSQQK